MSSFLSRKYTIEPILRFAWYRSSMDLCILSLRNDIGYIIAIDDWPSLRVLGAFKPKNSKAMFSKLVIELFGTGDLMINLPEAIANYNHLLFEMDVLKAGLVRMCELVSEPEFGIEDTYNSVIECDFSSIYDEEEGTLTDADRRRLIENYLAAMLRP